MADEADIANDYITNAISHALDKWQQNNSKPGAKQCIDCGEDIPEARRTLGLSRCIDCATELERRGSLFA